MNSLLKTTVKVVGSVLALSHYTPKVSTCVSKDDPSNNSARNAIAILQPSNNSNFKGIISFSQDNYSAPTKVIVNVIESNPNTDYFAYIHQYGDIIGSASNLGAVFEGKPGFQGIFIYGCKFFL